MPAQIRVDGLREVERDLLRLANDLGPRRARTVLNRPLRTAIQPVMDQIRATTPVDTGGLQQSIAVRVGGPSRAELRGDTLNRNDVAVARAGWFWRGGSLWFQATNVEYGNSQRAPGNILRGALESNQNRILSNLARSLGQAIEQRAARYARTGR